MGMWSANQPDFAALAAKSGSCGHFDLQTFGDFFSPFLFSTPPGHPFLMIIPRSRYNRYISGISMGWFLHILASILILTRIEKSIFFLDLNMSGKHKLLDEMWVKQCYKPLMTGNGKHTTSKNGDDWGMVYYCFISNQLYLSLHRHIYIHIYLLVWGNFFYNHIQHTTHIYIYIR